MSNKMKSKFVIDKLFQLLKKNKVKINFNQISKTDKRYKKLIHYCKACEKSEPFSGENNCIYSVYFKDYDKSVYFSPVAILQKDHMDLQGIYLIS